MGIIMTYSIGLCHGKSGEGQVDTDVLYCPYRFKVISKCKAYHLLLTCMERKALANRIGV